MPDPGGVVLYELTTELHVTGDEVGAHVAQVVTAYHAIEDCTGDLLDSAWYVVPGQDVVTISVTTTVMANGLHEAYERAMRGLDDAIHGVGGLTPLDPWRAGAPRYDVTHQSMRVTEDAQGWWQEDSWWTPVDRR